MVTFMEQELTVNESSYRIVRLLGKGKGGYSYLAERDGQPVVIKQIHHEPCDYYTFGNKLEAERRDYERLRAAGIRVPQMLAVDPDNERIVKAYIEGPTVFELIKNGASAAPFLSQARDMAARAKAAGLNIDYFPTNFVVKDGRIWYVDYECNEYMDEWSFENWGVRYWSMTEEFQKYLAENPENA
jgi:tRNA A-37 threonylcarbamoyl transferase component Bud32